MFKIKHTLNIFAQEMSKECTWVCFIGLRYFKTHEWLNSINWTDSFVLETTDDKNNTDNQGKANALINY